jgi:hypothetical protein
MKMDLAEIADVPEACYALVCKRALFSLGDASVVFPSAIANLLQEYLDIFPSELPPGTPRLRGIEHKIDLVPGASLPNRAATGLTHRRLKRFSDKSKNFWTTGTFMRTLVPVMFLFIGS